MSRLHRRTGVWAILGITFLTVAIAHARQDWYALGGELLDKGDFARALAAYERLLEERPDLDDETRSRVFNNVGYGYYKLGHLREARDYYTRALSITPDYATCLNNLGVLLINQKRYAEALPHLERAYRSDPRVKIVFNLFTIHYYLNHRRDALSFLEEAMRLDTPYTEARLRAKNVRQSDIERLKRDMK